MEIILASSNRGKIEEIQRILGIEVIPYKDLIKDLHIEETGSTFAQNAIIKAKTIYEKFPDRIVIADDSGISVPALDHRPGIFSARFAGEGASDKENLAKLVEELKAKGIKKAPAYYTAAIAIASPHGIYTVHGWMWGEVIDEPRGDKGFGYDPMFIPEGFDKTLGELDKELKDQISHRAKALKLAKIVLDRIK